MKAKYIILGIALILIIGVGLYTGQLQDIYYEIPYFDQIGIGNVQNIDIDEPTTNNYEITPSEIKNFGEKLDET